MSFNWNFVTTDKDGPSYDPFGYLLNGIFARVTDSAGSKSQSGSTIFSVVAGNVFGFRKNTSDASFNSASTAVNSFNTPVQGPLPLLGAGAAV
jgi:hypothetical protein